MSLDDLQAQLRGTLDQQFAALKQKYEEGIADARRQADAEAAAGREQARAEADARVRSVVAEARAAAERAVADKVGQARAEAEAQIRTVTEEIRAAAERDVAVKVERTRADFEQGRAEWETNLHAVAAAARAEEEQQAAEAVQREREEHEQKLEQAVNQAVAGARRTAELELESERRRAQNELEAARRSGKTEAAAATGEVEAAKRGADAVKSAAEADRQRAQVELDSLRHRMQTEIAAARAELDGLRKRMQTESAAARQAAASSSKPVAPPPAAPAVSSAAFERVLAATREIDGARTLSQALDSLITHAAAAAGRAAMFLINGDRLKAWKASGIPDIDVQTVESSIGAKDLLARAIQAGQATPSSAALPAPPFARLPADRAGLAVPLMIAGRAVAVLYVDSGPNPPPVGSAETVEALVRHASAIVALRTAMRTLDVLGDGPADGQRDGLSGGGGEVSGLSGGGGEVSDDQGARRYARLLVSEIKLYNEAAVRAGRQHRDLLQRLRAEIDRAQRLYEERVPPAVGGRHVYFHQELVQTLADGDPTLLGNA